MVGVLALAIDERRAVRDGELERPELRSVAAREVDLAQRATGQRVPGLGRRRDRRAETLLVAGRPVRRRSRCARGLANLRRRRRRHHRQRQHRSERREPPPLQHFRAHAPPSAGGRPDSQLPAAPIRTRARVRHSMSRRGEWFARRCNPRCSSLGGAGIDRKITTPVSHPRARPYGHCATRQLRVRLGLRARVRGASLHVQRARFHRARGAGGDQARLRGRPARRRRARGPREPRGQRRGHERTPSSASTSTSAGSTSTGPQTARSCTGSAGSSSAAPGSTSA